MRFQDRCRDLDNGLQLLRVRVGQAELSCVETADTAYHLARSKATNGRRSRHVLSDHFIGKWPRITPCKPIAPSFLLSPTIIT